MAGIAYETTAIERLVELPIRTQSRRVSAIMKSGRPPDDAIGNDIIEVAQGDKLTWTLSEATALIDGLYQCEDTLEDFLIAKGALNPESD